MFVFETPRDLQPIMRFNIITRSKCYSLFKLKEMKQKIKFGIGTCLEVNKKSALQQVEYWDGREFYQKGK